MFQSSAIGRRIVVALLAFVTLHASASSSVSEEHVLRVVDGDTLVLASPNDGVRVRLAEIDAPEHDQPYGAAARDALVAMVSGRVLRMVATGHDCYHRVVARLYVGDTDVNATLVRQGYAWVYRRYAHDPTLYAAERDARDARRGLWAQENPVPPWQWRAQQRGYSRWRRY